MSLRVASCISAWVEAGYPLRRYARLVGAPNCAPSLRSVAGLLLALALESAYEDTLTSLDRSLTARASPSLVRSQPITPAPHKGAQVPCLPPVVGGAPEQTAGC